MPQDPFSLRVMRIGAVLSGSRRDEVALPELWKRAALRRFGKLELACLEANKGLRFRKPLNLMYAPLYR
jgi:hypothetical protein